MAAFDHIFKPSNIKNSRYAPSPTGYLHLGNLSTAWQAFILAKKKQHPFILRIEDVDETRAIKAREADIINDLQTLGITWDYGPCAEFSDNFDIKKQELGPFYQSQRTHFYDIAFDYLLKNHTIYPCDCSRKDIQQHQDNNKSIYPRTCREKPMLSINTNVENVAWRFKSPDNVDGFYDNYLNKKIYEYEPDDFIIKRRDGFYAYQLAVVVDDILMNVGDIVRGQDLIDNTHWQILLYEALGYKELIPNYYHVPLILNEQGQKLSKRNQDNALSYWLNSGFTKDEIIDSLEKFSLPNSKEIRKNES